MRSILLCRVPILVVFLALLVPLAGADDEVAPVFHPTDAEPTCDWDNTCAGTEASQSQYSYCIARSAYDQKCQDSVWVIIPNSACAGGCQSCAYVQRSAACYCNPVNFNTTGKCSYW